MLQLLQTNRSHGEVSLCIPALLNQSFGFPLGFITPFIYSLYETGAFVDVTRGTNQIYPAPGYSAGAGWDACSGLGRIDGKNLLTGLQ